MRSTMRGSASAAPLAVVLALTLPAAATDRPNDATPGRTTIAQASKAACKQSCEANRLACMRASARNNAQGIPVTSPDDTKKCWDGFSACDKKC